MSRYKKEMNVVMLFRQGNDEFSGGEYYNKEALIEERRGVQNVISGLATSIKRGVIAITLNPLFLLLAVSILFCIFGKF